MYTFKRILVGLDFSEMDATLIQYTSMLCKLGNVEKVYFIHISKNLELPKEVAEAYPDLLAPTDEALTQRVQESLTKYFDAPNCSIEIAIKEGNSTNLILRWAKIKEIDLILMGRKLELDGKGVIPGKIATMSSCSVLLVPENTPFKISSILVPVDFSEFSKLAVEKALQIQQWPGLDQVKIHCQHVYFVPTGYHKSGKSYEEFAGIMKQNATNDSQTFLSTLEQINKANIHFECTLDEDQKPADKIHFYAEQAKVDLIIIGSKGRTAAAAILLGSIAEKLVGFNKHIPLLVVKQKGENLNFFEALFKL